MQWNMGRAWAYGLARRTPADRPPTPKPTAHPRTITVVGSGNIGGALARGWLAAGHTVRVATRDAAAGEVKSLVADGAQSVPLKGAAEGAEVVAFAIPAGAVVDTARGMGNLNDKIVVDCTNAIGRGFTLQYGLTTSSAEEVARALPHSRVVRSFNQQGAETLRNPVFGSRPAVNFVAADDETARHLVRDLSADLGLDSIEAGPVSTSRLLEPITILWVAMSQALGTRDFALQVLRR
jgi:predicted dinucleotide-binding enzyme